ncbi:hypothetical protein J2Y02_005351 [Neobacillus drentensis]|nr:hypothetical protein [Neobacillus drentensis]
MFNLNFDYGTLLTFVPGAKTPAGGRGRGGSTDRPRKAKRLERKSTGKFNRAYFNKIGQNTIN